MALSTALLLAASALFVATVITGYEILHGDDSGGPSSLRSITIAGPEETVFDWSRDACEDLDIPDAPARAFRDSTGRVQLIASHYVNRREVGPDLDHLTHRCEVIMGSDHDPLPQNFDDSEWITAPYTLDGRTIFVLVHNEYHGWEHPGQCSAVADVLQKCWYNTITFARSDDGGRTYRQPGGPAKLVAATPYRYEPDAGTYGIFQPSNIVYRESDRHYYSFVRAGARGVQAAGACLIRTSTLEDPSSWRAWDGSGFGVRFVDPYRSASEPSRHVCAPVAPHITMTESLTWNTYLEQYLLVGSVVSRGGQGIHYAVSPDLIHWSERRPLRYVEFPWTFECGDPPPVAYLSVLDPKSRSRNFETTGRRPWLYFTRFHYSDCQQTLDRDLIRVPLELSK